MNECASISLFISFDNFKGNISVFYIQGVLTYILHIIKSISHVEIIQCWHAYNISDMAPVKALFCNIYS